METVAPANEEAADAWNGVLFDRFLEFRDIMTTGLGIHGEEAMRCNPPQIGDRVLDIGCGFGDTSQRLAELVGPSGEVVGIDVAERFIEAARQDAAQAAVGNVRFHTCDVEVAVPGDGFDLAFSRMGTMFFANPVAALRNVRKSLVPGGRLCMVVWRRKLDNPWLHRAENIVEPFLTRPEETDEPTCGPGPFSMAGADTTSDMVTGAGFKQVSLRRFDNEIKIGDNLEHAVDMVMAIGPAGELIRLCGDDADKIRPELRQKLREGLADLERPDGVYADASTWIVTASAP